MVHTESIFLNAWLLDEIKMGQGRSVDLVNVKLLLSFQIGISVDSSQLREQVMGEDTIVGHSSDLILR